MLRKVMGNVLLERMNCSCRCDPERPYVGVGELCCVDTKLPGPRLFRLTAENIELTAPQWVSIG